MTPHPKTDLPTVEAPTLSPERMLLWHSAARMEKDGWRPNASGCALMTVDREALDRGITGQLYWDAVAVLMGHIGVRSAWDVAPWSDTSDQATVIAALRGAAVS